MRREPAFFALNPTKEMAHRVLGRLDMFADSRSSTVGQAGARTGTPIESRVTLGET